jgi:cytochrome c-type biogenesis protein CcmH
VSAKVPASRYAGRLIAALLIAVALSLLGGTPAGAKDLRCLVCQNESIADSNVELASDLRRQVREMLVAGKSDGEIFDFMTDRYGEFVRFNPPVDRKTVLIWGAPFVVLLLGVVIIVRIVRGRSRMPLDDEPSPGPL